jgi:CMP-N,N'-diacetyllegionaminic acid synthase
MNATAFIPAREGSKRLPGKNKKLFHGKPLIQWSIDQAKDSKLFNRIVVSTDDEEILELASKCKVTPVQRQAELATDEAMIDDVVFDFFARPENHTDYVCMLNPTHPLRSVSDIKKSFRYVKMKKYDAVVTVVWNDILGWVENATNIGPMVMYNLDDRPTRWTRDDWFLENGAIYWCKHIVIQATGTYIGDPSRVKLYEMPKCRSLEIDDAFDWHLCEQAYGWSE